LSKYFKVKTSKWGWLIFALNKQNLSDGMIMKKEKYCWEWSNVYKDEAEIDKETRQINIVQEKLGRIPKWANEIRQQITCISPC